MLEGIRDIKIFHCQHILQCLHSGIQRFAYLQKQKVQRFGTSVKGTPFNYNNCITLDILPFFFFCTEKSGALKPPSYPWPKSSMRNAPKHLQLSFQHAEVASDLERQQETITNSCSCFQVTIAILLQPFAELLMSSNWHRYWPVSGHTLKTVDTSTSL